MGFNINLPATRYFFQNMDTEVPMGELVVTKEGGNLTAPAVGSCLVITLYESKLKIGGMIHAMLPSLAHSVERIADRKDSVERIADSKTKRYTLSAKETDVKYVDTAIDIALEKMCSLGAERKHLEAKLVGGANMFGLSGSDIGRENIESAKKKLAEEGIKLIGESTGGSVGRSVEFSVSTGIVTVKIAF